MRFLMALALLALPAHADECFEGKPRQVSYSDGRVVTIIQRHGDDLTYTVPYEGYQDSVHKMHMMLFPKQARFGARSTENRWTSRLPKSRDLVPGFEFNLKGTMKSGDGAAVDYRIEGAVLGEDEVKIGGCPYPVIVVNKNTYLNDVLQISATEYLNVEMMVVLKNQVEQMSTGKKTATEAVALQ